MHACLAFQALGKLHGINQKTMFLRHNALPLATAFGAQPVQDLRHTFASYAALIQENTPTIARLLGHRGTNNSHRYMHLADRPVREAAEHVSALIAKAMRGKV
jgi:integrase